MLPDIVYIEYSGYLAVTVQVEALSLCPSYSLSIIVIISATSPSQSPSTLPSPPCHSQFLNLLSQPDQLTALFRALFLNQSHNPHPVDQFF